MYELEYLYVPFAGKYWLQVQLYDQTAYAPHFNKPDLFREIQYN